MKTKILSVVIFLAASLSLKAQPDAVHMVQEKDSLFWVAYNACDIEKMGTVIAENVEFYHDKGGITLGKENLLNSLKNNLCSNAAFRLRRQAIGNTVRLFPLKNGEELYGMIVSGEHTFYVLEKDAPERADGLANFTNLWLLKNGKWEMTRIFSFDHKPAPYLNKRTGIVLSNKLLDQYTGYYKGTNTGNIQVARSEQTLVLTAGDGRFVLYPEKDGFFFAKERDLQFEFKKDEKDKVAGLIVWEHGKIAEEAVAISSR